MCHGRRTPDIESNVNFSDNLIDFDEQEDEVPQIEEADYEIEVDEEQEPDLRHGIMDSGVGILDELTLRQRMQLLIHLFFAHDIEFKFSVLSTGINNDGDELEYMIDINDVMDMSPEEFLVYMEEITAELERASDSETVRNNEDDKEADDEDNIFE